MLRPYPVRVLIFKYYCNHRNEENVSSGSPQKSIDYLVDGSVDLPIVVLVPSQ